MAKELAEHNSIIFYEMMTHPALFSHPHPQKIVLISNELHLQQEILKHPSVTELWQLTNLRLSEQPTDPRVTYYAEDITSLPKNAFDVLIIATPFVANTIHHGAPLLHSNGVLIQQGDSPFELDLPKKIHASLHASGFRDIQLLHFPQPSFASGWRFAMMTTKQSHFKRIREKDIFNKPFITHYYNFDTHKGSLAVPEFMRETVNLEE